ncbi:MAG: hypothetical protein IKH54_01075 [Bacilli bacterium]|nr:hypothetical protein [Bacilli bacterium]
MNILIDLLIITAIFSFATGTFLNLKELNRIKKRKKIINNNTDATIRVNDLSQLSEVQSYNRIISNEKIDKPEIKPLEIDPETEEEII